MVEEERSKRLPRKAHATLGLGFIVFTPPHHKGDKEGDEADGGYDHGQEHILWGV